MIVVYFKPSQPLPPFVGYLPFLTLLSCPPQSCPAVSGGTMLGEHEKTS